MIKLNKPITLNNKIAEIIVNTNPNATLKKKPVTVNVALNNNASNLIPNDNINMDTIRTLTTVNIYITSFSRYVYYICIYQNNNKLTFSIS